MHVFELTKKLIDIESITPNERDVVSFLVAHLQPLVDRFNGRLELMPVEANRENIFVSWGQPVVTLSTHTDTVPPFIAASEDEQFIWGRGACDVKGIIAAMITACTNLLEQGERNFGLLLVVGEERNSLGAKNAAENSRGSKFLINGEPTGNKMALGSKGALRFHLECHGKMAHSAYPELGESAILKLLRLLQRLNTEEWPVDPILGASTLNIGLISGGRAPNVIPDLATAEILLRLVDDGEDSAQRIVKLADGLGQATEVLRLGAVHLGSLPGFETCVVSYTTDIPAFKGAWGKPFLLGPGSIHFAHTSEERVPKLELLESVDIYQRIVKELLQQ
jgi:acetylornithine deacetylase